MHARLFQPMIERFTTPGLAQVGYIVADPVQRVAAIIDPRRDVDEYLLWATENGYTIVAILETHIHADFISGARELAAATGAPVYAGRLGATEFAHLPLEDGDVVPVGRLTLQAFWTPGHTPEHVSYLLFDAGNGSDGQPVALFSGDTLFAGEIGRPDLLGEERTGDLVRQLHETVHHRLSALPDALAVFPGHGAGSPCGKNIGAASQTTIGQEKRFNYAFQVREPDDFARKVMSGMPAAPAHYPTLKRINKAGPLLVRELPDGEPLTVDQVETLRNSSALVIDARVPEAFAAGHVPGSVNVGFGDSFAPWAAALLPFGRPVVLILADDVAYESALTALRRVGVDDVAGYLKGGFTTWDEGRKPLARLDEMSVRELAQRLQREEDRPYVLDARDASEWKEGHIPGSHNVSTGRVVAGDTPLLPADQTIAVICGSGYRSSLAASALQASGSDNVATVPGGMAAWIAAGFDVE